ncbi:hypothetical protein PR202_ga25316 [Eleusine coracana subsp. coracana]|uniref:Uncharacterized protein n=1 Tax=Eleusine coracana subsp. coracana TaxID=191504 RepID=A0AAV5DAY7_ELECO|nr:hypothetical protein PR202_ga25316 [Eleusine coracana subsp. coracana]
MLRGESSPGRRALTNRLWRRTAPRGFVGRIHGHHAIWSSGSNRRLHGHHGVEQRLEEAETPASVLGTLVACLKWKVAVASTAATAR